MSQRESPLSQPATRIVGFDISHDDARSRVVANSGNSGNSGNNGNNGNNGNSKDMHNESPTSILEPSLTPRGLHESPTQASMASSQSKLSLYSSSSSGALMSQDATGANDESPPKSYLAEELKRHASLNLDNGSDDHDHHVKRGLPRLKIQRN